MSKDENGNAGLKRIITPKILVMAGMVICGLVEVASPTRLGGMLGWLMGAMWVDLYYSAKDVCENMLSLNEEAIEHIQKLRDFIKKNIQNEEISNGH